MNSSEERIKKRGEWIVKQIKGEREKEKETCR